MVERICNRTLFSLLLALMVIIPLRWVTRILAAEYFTEDPLFAAQESKTYLTWGDYDNDGDLDILVAGSPYYAGSGLKMYRNDSPTNGESGRFQPVEDIIPELNSSTIAWEDYDNDGDLDMLVMNGYISGVPAKTSLYRNDGADRFSKMEVYLANLANGIAVWGDFNADSHPDILLMGAEAGKFIIKIYRNETGEFTDANIVLSGAANGSVVCGDYDHDGDLDILLTGRDSTQNRIAKIYRNDGSLTFTPLEVGLTGVEFGAARWGDYDNDGDLDILLTGAGSRGLVAKVYRNDGSDIFTDLQADLTGVYYSAVAWGDYDNDGYQDFIIAGVDGSIPITKIYHNNGGQTFTELQTSLLGVRHGSVAWGDYDGDGKLDLLIAGPEKAQLYRNEVAPAPSWTFREVNTSLYKVSGATWGDYDRDGDLDVAQLGYIYRYDGADTFNKLETHLDGYGLLAWGDYEGDGDLDLLRPGAVYLNEGANTFTKNEVTLPSLSPGTATWADYDQDHDLDVLLIGDTKTEHLTGLYRNNGAGNFEDSSLLLPQLYMGAADWGDYDGDDDLDLIVSGCTTTPPCNDAVTKIYRNDGGSASGWHFTEIKADLPAVYQSAIVWKDYDQDGDADLLLTGCTDTLCAKPITKLYQSYDEDVFSEIATPFADVHRGAAAWGDYDGDGNPDLLLTGDTRQGPISHLYRNDGSGTFTRVITNLTGVYYSTAAWGDYDADNDQDILLTGYTTKGPTFKIYRNDGPGNLVGVK